MPGMISMEARLWKAKWARQGQKYSLSLVEHPKIKATGVLLEEVAKPQETSNPKAAGFRPHRD